MNKTVKDLVVGNEYIFIEANPQKSKDLNIVRAILKSNEHSIRGWFPLFETNDEYKGEFFFMYEPSIENDLLNKPLFIWVNSNYDKPEAKEKLEELFGTMRNPIGYIICETDNVKETIIQYGNFLYKSTEEYQKKIDEMKKDLHQKKLNYAGQINWLEKTLLNK